MCALAACASGNTCVLPKPTVTTLNNMPAGLLQDAEMAAKLQVYDEVVLECSQPWLEAPGALILPHNGRMFEVKVHLSLFALALHSSVRNFQ